jgi:hypothetical protein
LRLDAAVESAMILDTDRTDRFGQALFDALLEGFDHAWTQADFDDEPLDAGDFPAAPRRKVDAPGGSRDQ